MITRFGVIHSHSAHDTSLHKLRFFPPKTKRNVHVLCRQQRNGLLHCGNTMQSSRFQWRKTKSARETITLAHTNSTQLKRNEMQWWDVMRWMLISNEVLWRYKLKLILCVCVCFAQRCGGGGSVGSASILLLSPLAYTFSYHCNKKHECAMS